MCLAAVNPCVCGDFCSKLFISFRKEKKLLITAAFGVQLRGNGTEEPVMNQV